LKKKTAKNERIKRFLKRFDPAEFVFFCSKLDQASPGILKDDFTRWIYLLLKGRYDLIRSAYSRKIFDWRIVDKAVIAQLESVRTGGWEGCLFDEMNSLRVRTQANFIVSAIKETGARKVLETGTHKAMFCYLLHLCNSEIMIDTFGNLAESQLAVDILNNKYGPFIKYHFGDSRQTLGSFSPQYQIDLAWVDGGHEYGVCFSDMENCARLKIPHLIVDDYKWNDDVRKAVAEFIKRFDYEIKDISNFADYRGIVYLNKK